MSRRGMVVIGIFLACLLIANIAVVALWLPRRNNAETRTISSSPPPSSSSLVPPAQSPVQPAPAQALAASTPVASANFALERQVTSASGKVRVKYLRDPKSKLRQVAVEDTSQPNATTVLYQSQRPAWALISPDDQYVVVNERTAEGGGAALYRRAADKNGHFAPEGGESSKDMLKDKVWRAFLEATHADLNSPRKNVTIDATGWENGSPKLDLSVSYLATPANPDVPEPWDCTYNLVSKQVEPVSGQPSGDTAANEPSLVDREGSEPASAESSNQAAEANQSGLEDAGAGNNETAQGDEYPGEKFPATRLDELTVPDVNESDLSEINYAINEMLARHGSEFKDKNIAKQFSQFSWYQPRSGLTTREIEQDFSDLEKSNLKVLERCRDAKLAAAHRKSRPTRGQRVRDDDGPNGEQIMHRVFEGLGGVVP
jgi:hypothetical protein